MNKDKFNKFANQFKGKLSENKKLLVKNGMISKTGDNYEFTKTGKILQKLVKKELTKKK